jgi:hypothetical protein
MQRTAPVRAEAEAEVSREETPHIGVALLWALNSAMPIKFEVKRLSAIAPGRPERAVGSSQV